MGIREWCRECFAYHPCVTTALGPWFEILRDRSDRRWEAIEESRRRTIGILDSLGESVAALESPTTSIVVTGSLGRGEVALGSDLDWFLLVDGPADPRHFLTLREIEARLSDSGLKRPGRSATFGDLVTSHELIHYIAGTRDTNENLTRRILLLAESRALTNPAIREGVIRGILARYIVHDRPVGGRAGRPSTIPHFLLNDVVRYWRTMAADFASKMWERGREGWAIRNVKLRFSRKLIYVWGLLACFSWDLFPPRDGEMIEPVDMPERLAEHVLEQTRLTPLDLLSRMLVERTDLSLAADLIDTYDLFLEALSDPEKRQHLGELKFDAAADDALYDELRRASGRFSKGLVRLFFDSDRQLAELTKTFAMF